MFTFHIIIYVILKFSIYTLHHPTRCLNFDTNFHLKFHGISAVWRNPLYSVISLPNSSFSYKKIMSISNSNNISCKKNGKTFHSNVIVVVSSSWHPVNQSTILQFKLNTLVFPLSTKPRTHHHYYICSEGEKHCTQEKPSICHWLIFGTLAEEEKKVRICTLTGVAFPRTNEDTTDGWGKKLPHTCERREAGGSNRIPSPGAVFHSAHAFGAFKLAWCWQWKEHSK